MEIAKIVSVKNDVILSVEYKGVTFKLGDRVIVDDPTDEDDLWNHSFVAYIHKFHSIYIMVVDGDGDCWDVEPNKLTYQK